MENQNNTYSVLRVLVIGGILAILVFLSIGIVRVIPRALNTLASASVSLGSFFRTSTTTPATSGGFTETTPPRDATTTIYMQTPAATSTSPVPNPTPYSPRPANSGLTATPHPSYVNGTPDLAVSILSQGITDKTTGRFVATNTFTTSDTVVVKFKVENRGTAPTGTWSLHVVMPSQNTADQIRNVSNVGSLPPGSAVEGQVNFDQPTAGSPTVTLSVQTVLPAPELSTANDTASTVLSVSGYNNGNGNGTINTGSQPDLSARVVAVGILNSNNQFVPTSVFHSYDRIAVKFAVSNTGSNATGAWSFRADMNGNGYNNNNYNGSYNNQNYNSGSKTYTSNETSISGNTTLNYIVAFDNVAQGYNTLNILLDTFNQVSESNEGNNTLNTSVNVTY